MKAQLIVRNLEPRLVKRLQKRAAAHGRSAEAEHRAILEAALAPARDLKSVLLAMPELGADHDFARPRRRSRRVRL